jgi:hypothetical protein
VDLWLAADYVSVSDFPRLGGNEPTPPDDRFHRLGDERPSKPKRTFDIGWIGVAVIAFVGLGIWLGGAKVSFQNFWLTIDFTDQYRCASRNSDCSAARPEVRAAFSDPNACNRKGVTICIVPVGAVSLETIKDLRDRLTEEMGIEYPVAAPIDVPPDAFNEGRSQFNADRVTEAIEARYGSRSGDIGSLLIGVTPVDIYTPLITRWRFAFGEQYQRDDGRTSAIVSTYRMSNDLNLWIPFVTWDFYTDHSPESRRAFKLLNKYVGYAVFNLDPSDDPDSALYDHILSAKDLDRMSDKLPIGNNR